jgi:hypothetical protein
MTLFGGKQRVFVFSRQRNTIAVELANVGGIK